MSDCKDCDLLSSKVTQLESEVQCLTNQNRTTISREALLKMPSGKLLGVEENFKDQFGLTHTAVLWFWKDDRPGFQKAYFDTKTGEYLGEAL